MPEFGFMPLFKHYFVAPYTTPHNKFPYCFSTQQFVSHLSVLNYQVIFMAYDRQVISRSQTKYFWTFLSTPLTDKHIYYRSLINLSTRAKICTHTDARFLCKWQIYNTVTKTRQQQHLVTKNIDRSLCFFFLLFLHYLWQTIVTPHHIYALQDKLRYAYSTVQDRTFIVGSYIYSECKLVLPFGLL